MYGQAKYGDTSNYVVVKARSVSFQTCEIVVPRCEVCKRADATSNLTGLLTLLVVSGVAYFAITSWFELPVAISIFLALAAGALGWTAIIIVSIFAFPSSSSPIESNFYGNYPPIMEKIAQHWSMGDGPPGAIRI
jgi:hypothetical protein